MNRILFLVGLVFFGAMMSSCKEASFTAVDPPPPSVSDYWYTATPVLPLFGMVHDDQGGGGKPPLVNPRVIVGWEMPNDIGRTLYVYGIGEIKKNNFGGDKFSFDVTLRDTLPKCVLLNHDTTNALAIAHIFLVDNLTIKEGDTLRSSVDWDITYSMKGSLNDIVVVFAKGNPTLDGKIYVGTMPGYGLLRAKDVDPFTHRVIRFDPIDQNGLRIEVDDNGQSCKDQTPFWLQ